MKLRNKVLVLFLLTSVGLFSCSRSEDLGTSNIVVDAVERQGLDKWIYENLTTPLNIEVKYRWDHTELNLDKRLTPPLLSKVEPFLNVVKRVWAEPYQDNTIVQDENFLKKYCPKQFILVGSLSYNADGSTTVGTAEGGRKVVLYDLNLFVPTQSVRVVRMLHTMQHEFAHILHQNKMYPLEFKKITPNYTSAWMNYMDNQAQELGFISAYGRSSADEDFAEMVANMLTKSRTEFDAEVNAIASEEAKNAIRKKEVIVVKYFQEAYGIDFYKLQARIYKQMTDVLSGN